MSGSAGIDPEPSTRAATSAEPKAASRGSGVPSATHALPPGVRCGQASGFVSQLALLPAANRQAAVRHLSRGIGNAAVSRLVAASAGSRAAAPSLQRQAGSGEVKTAPTVIHATVGTDEFAFFGEKHGDITVKVGVPKESEAVVRGAIAGIVKELQAGNAEITTARLRVALVLIAPTTSRLALYQGKPVLLLETADANPATAAHEM